jgi:hypothetical protein
MSAANQTARQMSAQIGQLVYLEAAPGMRVVCITRDVRRAFGRIDLEIEPAQGTGRAWVNASSVTPLSADEARKAVE